MKSEPGSGDSVIGIRGYSSEVFTPPLGARVGSLCLPQATLPPQPHSERNTPVTTRPGNPTSSSPVNAESWNGSILGWKAPYSSSLVSSARAVSPAFGTCTLQRLGAQRPRSSCVRNTRPSPLPKVSGSLCEYKAPTP